MKGIENQKIVLVLDALWRVHSETTVKDALTALSKDTIYAIDFEYYIGANGERLSLNSMNPVSWEKWINLPVNKWNLSINTSKFQIRVPTVIIAKNFSKTIKKKISISLKTVAERDNWIDQYTGEKLTKSNATLDHVIPKDRGGKHEWTNVVLCEKKRNNKKGNRLNHEVGLKLIRQPSEMLAVPAWSLIKEAKHEEWNHFIMQN